MYDRLASHAPSRPEISHSQFTKGPRPKGPRANQGGRGERDRDRDRAVPDFVSMGSHFSRFRQTHTFPPYISDPRGRQADRRTSVRTRYGPGKSIRTAYPRLQRRKEGTRSVQQDPDWAKTSGDARRATAFSVSHSLVLVPTLPTLEPCFQPAVCSSKGRAGPVGTLGTVKRAVVLTVMVDACTRPL